MLKRYNQVFLSLLVASDLITIGGAWMASYWLRFYLFSWQLTLGIPEFELYLWLSLLVLPVSLLSMKIVGLYTSYRVRGFIEEFFDILQAVSLAVIIVAVTSFFYRDYSLSRMVMGFFWILCTAGLNATRYILRSLLRYFRSRGYNLRHVLIIGSGPVARVVAGKMME